MAYQRKTRDEIQLMSNYGYGHGWEYECSYKMNERKQAKEDIKEYRLSCPSASYKLVTKRVKINA